MNMNYRFVRQPPDGGSPQCFAFGFQFSGHQVRALRHVPAACCCITQDTFSVPCPGRPLRHSCHIPRILFNNRAAEVPGLKSLGGPGSFTALSPASSAVAIVQGSSRIADAGPALQRPQDLPQRRSSFVAAGPKSKL